MRAIIFAVMLSGCATPASKPCEFPLWVRVTPDADGECRALGVKRRDDGSFVKDTDTIKGCAPIDRIITDGSESNMGHEMAHHMERNCR